MKILISVILITILVALIINSSPKKQEISTDQVEIVPSDTVAPSSNQVSKPWWNGSKIVHLCAINTNSNDYGCYQVEVASDGSEITSFDLPVAGGGQNFTSGTVCGKSEVDGIRYCDFKDRENRDWEVKNTK